LIIELKFTCWHFYLF